MTRKASLAAAVEAGDAQDTAPDGVITVDDLLARCRMAVRASKGERPALFLAISGRIETRRHLLRMGPARLSARVVGPIDAGKRTLLRLFVDEVLHELERAGLVRREVTPVDPRPSADQILDGIHGAVKQIAGMPGAPASEG